MQPDPTGQETFKKTFKLKQKANFEAIVFFRKPLESESLWAEVQFVIHSCCLVNQSI